MKNKTLMGALAIGATALMITACSGSAAPEPGGNEGSSEPDKVRLIVAPVYYEPVYIAEEEGFFEDQNLDVEIIQGGTASENTAMLIAGQADIAMSGAVSVIQGAAEGLDVRVILGASSSDSDATPTAGLLATPESGITTYGDLGGKTVGLQGLNETTHLGTLLGAQSEGVDTDTITFVQLPLPNLNEALTSGEVDAVYNIGVFYGQGLSEGFVKAGEPALDVLPWSPSVVYAASDAYVEANPDVIERFQTAIADASELGRADDFQRIREVQIEMTDQDPEYLMNAQLAGYQTDSYREGYEKTLDGMYEFGFIDTELTTEDVVNPVAPFAD